MIADIAITKLGGDSVIMVDYEESPIDLVVPYTGHWHTVIDLGGGSGTIRHSISIIKR